MLAAGPLEKALGSSQGLTSLACFVISLNGTGIAAILGKIPGDRCRSGKEWMSGLFEEKNKAVSHREKLD